jgi:alanine dehydrogenase
MERDALWITESDVVDVLSLSAAIDAVGAAFLREAQGRAAAMAKTHVAWGGGSTLHALGAVDEVLGIAGAKTWAHTAGGAVPLLQVWDSTTGRLSAVIEAFALGQLRTGAVSGTATAWLARQDARTLAIIGTGKQALPQVASVAAVCDLEDVRVHSPSPEHRERFVRLLENEDFGFTVTSFDSVAAAVDGADVVTTVTRAREPFLTSALLSEGAHVNAIGAITPERRELAPDVLRRTSTVVSDSVDAARRLATELADVANIISLADVAAAGSEFDRGRDITVFKAMGVGLADIALAGVVIESAWAHGLGRPIPQPTKVTPRLKEGS